MIRNEVKIDKSMKYHLFKMLVKVAQFNDDSGHTRHERSKHTLLQTIEYHHGPEKKPVARCSRPVI